MAINCWFFSVPLTIANNIDFIGVRHPLAQNEACLLTEFLATFSRLHVLHIKYFENPGFYVGDFLVYLRFSNIVIDLVSKL